MEFITIAFSTFFGATVALLAERLTRAHDAALREEAALNNLILDLATKRAFLTADGWEWSEDEVKRVVDSIFHARDLVRDARLSLRPRSRALGHLREMARACNGFLEVSERDQGVELQAALTRLTADMSAQVRALHALRPGRILADEPGSFALRASA